MRGGGGPLDHQWADGAGLSDNNVVHETIALAKRSLTKMLYLMVGTL